MLATSQGLEFYVFILVFPFLTKTSVEYCAEFLPGGKGWVCRRKVVDIAFGIDRVILTGFYKNFGF